MRTRNTRQMEVIEAIMREAARPLAIPELHALARKKHPTLGIATVYRALGTLTERESVVSLNYPGQPTRYERAMLKDHSHFICSTCKRIYDIDAPEKVPLPKKRPKGFQFKGDEVVYFGICADCRE